MSSTFFCASLLDSQLQESEDSSVLSLLQNGAVFDYMYIHT